MAEPIPLTPQVTEKLYEQGGLGREALAAGDVKAAEAHFLAAWNCIPEPRLQHDFAGPMTVALTEFYRDNGMAAKAMPWLALAREAYGPAPNPHTEFLAATVHYQAGELDEAFVLFDSLYKQYRRRPFQDEKPEYLSFYLGRAGGKG